MNYFRVRTAPLLAAALALTALSPWTPLTVAVTDAQAQRSCSTRHASFGHSGHFSGHKSSFRSRSHGIRSFGFRHRRSFGHSKFGGSFKGSFHSSVHRPRATVFVTGGFDQGHRAPAPSFSAPPPSPSYPATPSLSAQDGWAHLIAGRPAQAQVVFGTLAGAAPHQAVPKIGYGLAALLRGDFTTGESAFLRAHRVDANVWQTLSRRPEARAAAADLLSLPEVQASENLRSALTMLAGPSATPAPAAAPAMDADGHDYDVPSTQTVL